MNQTNVVGIKPNMTVKEVLNWLAEVDEEHRSINWNDFDFYSTQAVPTRVTYSKSFDDLSTDWRPYRTDEGKKPTFCLARSVLVYGRRYTVWQPEGKLGVEHLTLYNGEFRHTNATDSLPETTQLVRPHVYIYKSSDGNTRQTVFGYRFQDKVLIVPVSKYLTELIIDYGHKNGSVMHTIDPSIKTEPSIRELNKTKSLE